MTTDTTSGTPYRTSPSRIPGQATRAAHPSLGPDRGPRLGRLVRSEWTKLRSLRSTWWTLALAALIGIGFAAAVAASVGAGDISADALGADDVALVLGATGVAALVLGVLGALQMSSEYASGTISVSLTAVPRRRPLLAAKAAVLVAVVAPCPWRSRRGRSSPVTRSSTAGWRSPGRPSWATPPTSPLSPSSG